jgi:Ca2+-binding RTX toxin-like protein
MSLLGRGRGRRRAAVFVAAGSLFGFQALAVIGAQVASAATTCGFNVGTGAVTVGLDGSDTFQIIGVVDTAGNIELTSPTIDCGSATKATTTSVSVSSTAGVTNETFEIDNNDAGGAFAATTSWAVDLAGGTSDYLGFDGSDSADTMTFGNTTFTMNGGAGTTAGVEFLYTNGNDGNDVLDGSAITSTGPAFDDMDGDDGDDTLKGGGALDDSINGGNGDDTINGGGGNDFINGDGDVDTIAGDAGNDTLDGGGGNDVIDEGTAANGSDIIDGDGDTAFPYDIVDYSGRTNAVTVTVGTGANDGESGENDDVTGGTDGVLGGSGADSLTGDSDTNWLSGGPGNDTLNGGTNDDTAAYDTAPAAVTVDLAAGTATGGAGSDTLTSMEDAVGSAFNDTLTGDANNNDLDGRGGNDLIAGAAGSDNELGGAGNDTFNEGAAANGSDDIQGEAGLDWVNYGARTNAVSVSLNTGADDGESGEGDDVDTVENATLGTGDDTFLGDGFNNIVQPNGGQNILGWDRWRHHRLLGGLHLRGHGRPRWRRLQRRCDLGLRERDRHGVRRLHHRKRYQQPDQVRQGRRPRPGRLRGRHGASRCG